MEAQNRKETVSEEQDSEDMEGKLKITCTLFFNVVNNYNLP